MKNTFAILIIIFLLSSCATHSGRVCGGPGGRRCVENQKIKTLKVQANYKRIS